MTQGATGEAAPPRPGLYGYYVLAVLTLVYMFSTVDRTLISVLAEPIKRDFHLSDGELGLLTGLAFAISYSVAGIPLGLLADRMSRTKLLAGLVTVWSGLTFVSGLATTPLALMLARIGVGASEAGASPASMSIITDYFPKERRGLALSLFYVSAPIGVALTFSVGGAVAAAHGWHAAYWIAGGPGIVLALLILLTVREPLRGRFDPIDPVAAREKYRFGEAFRTLVAIRPLLYLLLAAVCVVVAQAGTGAFLSPFLIRVHHIDVAKAGQLIGAVMGPTGIVGLLSGGLVADLLARRSQHRAVGMVGWLMALTGVGAFAAFLVPQLSAALVFTGLFNFLNHTYYGATFSTFMTLAPARMRGALGGMFAVSLTMIGYGFGPPLAGVSSDLFESLGAEQPLRWAMVLTASFFLISGLIFWLAVRAIRRLDAAA